MQKVVETVVWRCTRQVGLSGGVGIDVERCGVNWRWWSV